MSTPLYVRFTSDATEMAGKLSDAKQKLNQIRIELVSCESKLRKMAPELCRLSMKPDHALDEFIQHKYNPKLAEKNDLVARKNDQKKLVRRMQDAMLEAVYHTDVMAQLAKRVEKTHLEQTQCSEEELINAAKAEMAEGEIREKISARRVEITERTTGPKSAPEKGDIVWIRENTSGRSWCVDWRMPAIVLKNGVLSDGITRYAVCFIDPDFDRVQYRLVIADEMLSQTKVPV